MSYITDIARTVLGNNLYLDALNRVYGMRSSVDIFKEWHRYMVIRALDWNDNNDYYTQEQLDCLNGVVHRRIKTPTTKRPVANLNGQSKI